MKKRKNPRLNLFFLFPGLFVLFGIILIYIAHASNTELVKIGLTVSYDVTFADSFLRGFLLGVINFLGISWLVYQAIYKRSLYKKAIRLFSKNFLSETNPKNHEIAAHFTSVVCGSIYFISTTILMFLTDGALNPNFIITSFALGCVLCLTIWQQIFIHHFPFEIYLSTKRIELEHNIWVEILKQLITIGLAALTGLVIFGVVSWIVYNPQSITGTQAFQTPLFTLAAVCIYIYVGFFIGVLSPVLIFTGKLRDRIEKIDSVNKHKGEIPN